MSEVVIDIRTVGADKVKQAADQIADMGRVSEELTGKLSYANRMILRQVEADKKLAATKSKLQKAVNDGVISQGKMNTAMKEAHRVAREFVVTDKEAVRIAKERAKAEKKKSDQVEALRKKHDASYRVQQEQNKLIAEYDLLLNEGHISLKEHAHLVDRATKEVKEFNAALVKGGNQFGKFDQNAYKSAQTLKRRFNQGVQQAGYQVGDFFVQIQSGTDALVALGQQGSQLALVLGKHGPMIGAVIAIGTAMATMAIQTIKATRSIKEFDDVIGDLDDSTSKLESLYDIMTAKPEEIAASHKLLRGELLELIRVQAEFEKGQAEKAIDTGLAAEGASSFLQTPLGLTETMSDVGIADKLGVTPEDTPLFFGFDIGMSELSQRQKELLDEYRKFAGEFKAAAEVGPEEQLRALQDLLGVVQDLGVDAPEALQKLEANLAGVIIKGSEAAKALEQLELAQEFGGQGPEMAEAGSIGLEQFLLEVGEAAMEAAEKFKERKEDQEDFVQSLLQEAAFYQEMQHALEEGNLKTLEQVEDLNQARELQNRLLELGLEPSDQLYQDAVAYAKTLRESKATALGMVEAIKKASSSFDTLLKQSTNLDVEIAKVEAQIEALEAGTNAAAAAYIAGEKAKIAATAETTRALAIQTNNIILLAETAIAYTEAMDKLEKLEGLRETLADLKGSSGGGGGDSKKDPLAEIRERIKLDTELLNKTKERQEVERAIANASKTYSKDAVDEVVAQLEAYNLLVEKQKEVQGLYDTVQSALEDNFMAIIDGTKSLEDAFKDMARVIIRELYNVLVVKQIVGSFDKATGMGSGIMGFLGNLDIFDGGGYTGSGPRSGGLDGRGGYLAMVHPRETIIDHTKAGPSVGENITVVQNFSFQANGDDSVKKIIAQAAPQIANMTQKQIMDARRRGGAMKSAFG